MARYGDSFDPKADSELDALLTNPVTEIIATELLARIGLVIGEGLEDGEFPVTFCRDWSPLYIRRKRAFFREVLVVFTLKDLPDRGPVMHILSANRSLRRAMRDALERC